MVDWIPECAVDRMTEAPPQAYDNFGLSPADLLKIFVTEDSECRVNSKAAMLPSGVPKFGHRENAERDGMRKALGTLRGKNGPVPNTFLTEVQVMRFKVSTAKNSSYIGIPPRRDRWQKGLFRNFTGISGHGLEGGLRIFNFPVSSLFSVPIFVSTPSNFNR